MAIETKRPTSHSTTTFYTEENLPYAYDNDVETSAVLYYRIGTETFTVHTWAAAGKTYSALKLVVVTRLSTQQTGLTHAIDYSINGGSSWTNIRSWSSADTTTYTDEISLSSSQDLSLLQFRYVGGGFNGSNYGIFRVYDVRTEGTYTDSTAGFFLNFI